MVRIGGGRIKLISIADLLIVEYAAFHSHLSIRAFLLKVKGLTEMQYYRIVELVLASQWQARFIEVQNLILSRMIEREVGETIEAKIAIAWVRKIAAEPIGAQLIVRSCSPQEAKSLWKSRSPLEKRQLLEKVLWNPRLDPLKVRFELGKTFLILSEMKRKEKWGD